MKRCIVMADIAASYEMIKEEFKMAISEKKIYPRSRDAETVYLKNVVTDPGICVGDYTIYNDFKNDPREFQTNNVLFH